jgi:TusA-related sulfurtransferase
VEVEEGAEKMTTNEIVEIAIQGHASTRDAIRWAIEQEREACAKVCETFYNHEAKDCAEAIRARGGEK